MGLISWDAARPWRDGMKTNAVRLLEEMGVVHELRAYEVDPDDLTAQTVANKIGLPAEQVFKTLVARGDRHGVCFAVVPGNCRLDLKALAKLTGDRKTETVPLKEVQPLTGYVRGGVTVLGAKKAYPVYADETIELFQVVSVSAGMAVCKSSGASGLFASHGCPTRADCRGGVMAVLLKETASSFRRFCNACSGPSVCEQPGLGCRDDPPRSGLFPASIPATDAGVSLDRLF